MSGEDDINFPADSPLTPKLTILERRSVPRKGLRKTSPVRLRMAIEAVRKGTLSLRNSSEYYRIPVSTLSDKLRGKHLGKIGPETRLSTDEETDAANYIKECGRRGLDATVEVQYQLFRGWAKNNPNSHKHGMPTKHWFRSFAKKYNIITQKQLQSDSGEKSLTRARIHSWFIGVKSTLNKNFGIGILKDASRVFSADVNSVAFATPDQSVTVMLTTNAKGVVLPPFLIFLEERREPWHSLAKGFWSGFTQTGRMTAESFHIFIVYFNAWLQTMEVTLPVVLVLDNDRGQWDASEELFCQENGIILVFLPQGSSHILQALDSSFFASLRTEIQTCCDNFKRKHPRVKVVSELASDWVLNSTMKLSARMVQTACRKAGIFPFDRNAVDYSKLGEASEDDLLDLKSESEEDLPEQKKLRSIVVPVITSTVAADVTAHIEHFCLGPELVKKYTNAVDSGVPLDDKAFEIWYEFKKLSLGEMEVGGNMQLDSATYAATAVPPISSVSLGARSSASVSPGDSDCDFQVTNCEWLELFTNDAVKQPALHRKGKKL